MEKIAKNVGVALATFMGLYALAAFVLSLVVSGTNKVAPSLTPVVKKPFPGLI